MNQQSVHYGNLHNSKIPIKKKMYILSFKNNKYFSIYCETHCNKYVLIYYAGQQRRFVQFCTAKEVQRKDDMDKRSRDFTRQKQTVL